MAPLSRGGVENTKHEAKDTKKIRGQEQSFRGPKPRTRPRTGKLEAKDQGHSAEVISKKKDLCSKIKKRAVLESRIGHFRGLADFKAKDFKSCF